MDTIVSGKKGSGKTYYAVHYISTLKPEDQEKVYHNIDGLELGNKFDDYCKEKNVTLLNLFSESYHEQNTDLHGSIFVLDECQKIFPKYFKGDDNLHFFQMSRHWNIDVILLTQDISQVCNGVSVHPELQLKAVPDIANPYPGFFVYKEMSGTEKVGEIKIRKKNKIFKLYKSANYKTGGKERKKIKPMQKLFFIACIGVIFACYLGYRFFTGFGDGSNVENFTNNTTHQEQPTPKERIDRYSQKHFNHDSTGSTVDNYPPSIIEKLNGVPINVSVLEDSTGSYVILLGVAYPFDGFPFELLRTRLGVVAIVPEDIYQADKKYQEDSALLASYDPNEKYYWHDQPSEKQQPEM